MHYILHLFQCSGEIVQAMLNNMFSAETGVDTCIINGVSVLLTVLEKRCVCLCMCVGVYVHVCACVYARACMCVCTCVLLAS